MKNVKRVLYRAICAGLALVLVACGNGGKGIPPEEKHVVIGTADHIKAKRESTHRPSKPLPTGIRHKRLKNGVPIADDAPHPYTLSSGTLLVRARSNALLQVAYHEDAAGKLADVLPSSFVISDPAIVSSAIVDPLHANAALLTLTGKKGNTFITALDARGDAISKFMVLSAEPQDDVVVIDDPSIRPVLCEVKQEYKANSCQLETSTDFTPEGQGDQFSLDSYVVRHGGSQRAAFVLDREMLSKVPALQGVRNKRAVYFEALDVLFVMTDERSADYVTKSRWGQEIGVETYPAFYIDHIATQKEFNTYIDFGGQLSSSPLRDFDQQDTLIHEITPDKPTEAVLVGAILTDGSRLNASSESLQYLEGASRSPIKTYVYQMRQVGSDSLGSGLECHASVTAGKLLKYGFSSLKSVATVTLGGAFDWSGGRPHIGLDLNPQVNVGGMLKFGLDGRVAMTCGVELYEFKLAEWGVPILGSIHVALPLELKIELGVNGSGDLVLTLPAYDLGSPGGTNTPGKVGVQYSPDGGFKTDFAMKSTLAKDRMGVAEGTKLKDSVAAEIGMSHEAGIAAGLTLRAKVKTWIFHAEVDANIAEVLVGASTEGSYKIDTEKQTSKRVSSEGESGIGAFFSASPSIQVKTSFFTLSFNLFELKAKPIWFYKLPFSEEKEESFDPVETSDATVFSKCYNFSQTCNEQTLATPYKLEYVTSSQKFEMKEPETPFYGRPVFTYKYAFKDKATGYLIYKDIPLSRANDDSLTLQAFKYGVTNVLAEGVVSSQQTYGDSREYCLFWSSGDFTTSRTFSCAWR